MKNISLQKEKPIIGLTMDSSTAKHYSQYPWYALRENYCDSVASMHATPIPIPHIFDAIDDYLDLIDGLILTGGDFDHDPKLYHATEIHAKTMPNATRSAFEFELLKRALKRNIPFLGICAGQQLLNIYFGGDLFQHIPDDLPQALNHLQSVCRHKPQHSLLIEKDTLLFKASKGTREVFVNTSHHQAVKNVGQGLRVSAKAPDGVIEGIEHPDYDFCLGVQWHPEFIVSDFDREIYHLFIEAARNYCRKIHDAR